MFIFFSFTTGLSLGCFLLYLVKRSCSNRLKKLREENQQLAREKKIAVEFMHNLAEAIGEGVDRKVLYQRILHTAIIGTGAMSACIYEKLPNGRLKGVALEGLFPPQRAIRGNIEEENIPRARFIEKVLSSEVLEVGEGIVGEVAQTGKPTFIRNALDDPRVVKHSDASLAIHSMVVSPLVHNDHILGVLAVANPSNGQSFSEIDFSMINSLGEQAALAIKNSDAMNLRMEKTRMDADLRLAHDVQELFLTHIFPLSEGIEVDAKYIPSSQVGGDFYDFYKLSPHKFFVCIADVSGKGVPASLLMALCQTHLKHLVHESHSPSEVLSLLNKELFSRIRPDMFITLFLATFDTSTSQLSYARAGHEPALLFRKNGDEEDILELRGNGIALGIVEPELFSNLVEDKSVNFCEGDILCLYTDGVTELSSEEKEEFGIERLKQSLTRHSGLDPQSLNAKLVDELNLFSPPKADRDDLTLLTIKRLG